MRSRLLQDLDPRLKIVLTVWMGIRIWQMDPIPAAVMTILAGVTLYTLHPAPGKAPVSLKGAALTVGLWMAIKISLDLLLPEPGNVWQEGILLGVRLSFVLCLGSLFFLTTSMRQVSLAVVQMTRPILKDRAWKTGLALGLMVHFIPTALATARQVRQAVSLRCDGIPLPVRASLLIRGCLRSLGEKTWSQTLALAARGFDTPDAWVEAIPFRFREWLWAAAAVSAVELLG